VGGPRGNPPPMPPAGGAPPPPPPNAIVPLEHGLGRLVARQQFPRPSQPVVDGADVGAGHGLEQAKQRSPPAPARSRAVVVGGRRCRGAGGSPPAVVRRQLGLILGRRGTAARPRRRRPTSRGAPPPRRCRAATPDGAAPGPARGRDDYYYMASGKIKPEASLRNST
jgi:hypothetical protein